jgi:hypothetical protein
MNAVPCIIFSDLEEIDRCYRLWCLFNRFETIEEMIFYAKYII